MKVKEVKKLKEESKHGILEIKFSQDFGARGRNILLITEIIVHATADSMIEGAEEFTEKRARERIGEIEDGVDVGDQIEEDELQEYENYKAYLGIS